VGYLAPSNTLTLYFSFTAQRQRADVMSFKK
jgi:hypothetical protein